MDGKLLLSRMFHEDYFNFLSLITVLGDKRDIGRLVVSEDQREELSSYLKGVGIKFEFIKRSETEDAFLFEGGKNKYLCQGKDFEMYKKKNYYMYVSKYAKLIKCIKESEIGGGVKTTGSLFGYPRCCINKYTEILELKVGQLSDVDILNFISKNSQNKRHFPFYNNFGSYGKTLILHFPCNYNCKCSSTIGKENFKLINKISRKLGGFIKFCLTRPCFISEHFLINFKYDNPTIGNVYHTNEFVAKGIETKYIKVVDNNSLEINNEIFGGRFLFFR